MKKFVICLLICPVLYSCFRKGEVADNRKCCLLQPTIKMRSLLDSFVSVNGKNDSVYEIYINKVSPHESDLLIHAGNTSLTAEENKFNDRYPINDVTVSGVHFFIYTGLESYFSLSEGTISDTINRPLLKEMSVQTIWTVRDSMGILKIKASQDAYPFLPFPNTNDKVRFKYPSAK